MRKSSRRLLWAAVCLAAGIGRPAAAQWAVIDAANLAQTTLTAARSLREVNNQITQIQQMVQSLQNQARNLTALPFSIQAELDASVTQITSLMNEASGILYDVANVQSQFTRFYPQSIDPSASDVQLVADAQTRWQYSLSSFQHTMELQSEIVQGLPADQAQMDALVAQSQDAAGILEATQAGNQLTALQAKQLMATETLLATQARAQAIEQARQAEAEEEAREQYRRFLGSSPGDYSPPVVVMFH